MRMTRPGRLPSNKISDVLPEGVAFTRDALYRGTP